MLKHFGRFSIVFGSEDARKDFDYFSSLLLVSYQINEPLSLAAKMTHVHFAGESSDLLKLHVLIELCTFDLIILLDEHLQKLGIQLLLELSLVEGKGDDTGKSVDVALVKTGEDEVLQVSKERGAIFVFYQNSVEGKNRSHRNANIQFGQQSVYL